MVHKIQKAFTIFFIVLLLVDIGIKFAAQSNGKGAYYLYRALAWVNFVKVTENMDEQKLDYGTLYSNSKLKDTDYHSLEKLIKDGDNSTKNILNQSKQYPLRIVIFSTAKDYEKAFIN